MTPIARSAPPSDGLSAKDSRLGALARRPSRAPCRRRWKARPSAITTDWPCACGQRFSQRRIHRRIDPCGCCSEHCSPSPSPPFVGLGATYLALTRGAAFGAVPIGAWTAWPKTGTADADPYARAAIARTGELPIGARRRRGVHCAGRRPRKVLDGRCDVDVSAASRRPRGSGRSRSTTRQGQLVANSVNRHGFTSQENRAQHRRHLQHRRAPARHRQLAADRRRRALSWCCGSTTPRSASPLAPAREAPMPSSRRELP